LGAACSYISKPDEANASPGPQQNRQATNLSRLYSETCAKCHGEQGEGGGGGTRTLLTRELFDQQHDRRFFEAIKDGVPHAGMEAYGATLSDAEIWGLVVHIRELQARALRAESGSPKETNGVYSSQHHAYRVETVVDTKQGLNVPWGMDWLPDGRMLVTNRPGAMFVVKDGKLGNPVQGTPAVIDAGQGGLMDVAVHPDYRKNGWIYLSLSDPAKAGGRDTMTKIVRGKLRFQGDQAQWTDQQTIFETEQANYNRSGLHFGSKIVFDGKGHVFFSIGERGNAPLAQDLSKPNGKIYRVREDGSIPKDNPFVGTQGAIPAVWSYGHRNPQGLVLGLDGTLWDTEHAPRGGDEVNRIQKGANYGWPVVSFGINYNDSPHSTPWPGPGQNFLLPVFRWLPSIGASGLDVVRGNAFPKWKGDLVAGGLSGNNLDRLRIVKDKIVEREELVHGMGRVREVATGPDGTIYLLLNGPDKIVRLVPAR
jgi:glucose/arabinose dehydrogenase